MLIGTAIPLAYLSFLRARRLKKLRSQLPDVFDLMSQCSAQAARFRQAVSQSVGDEFPRFPLRRNSVTPTSSRISDYLPRPRCATWLAARDCWKSRSS